jgi:hypothetical protein
MAFPCKEQLTEWKLITSGGFCPLVPSFPFTDLDDLIAKP